MNFTTPDFLSARRSNSLNYGEKSQEVIHLWSVHELWSCGSADESCFVAALRENSELIMLCNFMAVHHVLFEMYKSEVYHFPDSLVLHSQRLMVLADPNACICSAESIRKYISFLHYTCKRFTLSLTNNTEAYFSHNLKNIYPFWTIFSICVTSRV